MATGFTVMHSELSHALIFRVSLLYVFYKRRDEHKFTLDGARN